MRVRPQTLALCAVLTAVACVIGAAAARAPSAADAAARPERAETVLARVPPRRNEQGRRITSLESAARAAPRDLRAALALARAHIEASRSDGDPRPLGYAEAVLAPFVRQPSAPLLVLQATIHQARHQFDPALDELARALELDPGDAQAWLTQASLLTVRGRYAEALHSCAQLRVSSPPLVGAMCQANIAWVTGRARWASAVLQTTLARAHSAQERAWVLSVSCEVAYWSGAAHDAERACRAALALDAGDRYTRALLADLLLDRDQPAQAFALCEQRLEDDALLLRASLAAARLGRRDAAELRERAQARFALNRLRGDAVHLREEARLLLAARDGAPRALALAEQNFAQQKEPWDARLLLEAALAARAPRAARPALTWLHDTQFEAPRLATLRAQLNGAP